MAERNSGDIGGTEWVSFIPKQEREKPHEFRIQGKRAGSLRGKDSEQSETTGHF